MDDYTSLSDAGIVDAIEQTHALLCAVQETLLTLASEYDRRQAWVSDGARSLWAGGSEPSPVEPGLNGWSRRLRASRVEA